MLSKLFEVHHFKLWKRIWNVLLFQQWLYKNCRKKLILKIEIPLKNIATRMHDDPFTKHILDYLQRIIYNRRENVSSKNFSFRMWNTQYHTSFSEKSYLRYCYKWTYHRTICLKKGQQKVFGQFLPKFFNKNPKNK